MKIEQQSIFSGKLIFAFLCSADRVTVFQPFQDLSCVGYAHARTRDSCHTCSVKTKTCNQSSVITFNNLTSYLNTQMVKNCPWNFHILILKQMQYHKR